MSRRRLQRRERLRRRSAAPAGSDPASVGPPINREATRVERLAYTRTQAAQALGVSRSTFIRRVLPYLETIEMPWGAMLVPVDEVERFVAERRRTGRAEPAPLARPGRKPGLSAELLTRIRTERARGRSLGEIARGLNADRVPTAQGGRQWWSSTVRAALTGSRPTKCDEAVNGGDQA